MQLIPVSHSLRSGVSVLYNWVKIDVIVLACLFVYCNFWVPDSTIIKRIACHVTLLVFHIYFLVVRANI